MRTCSRRLWWSSDEHTAKSNAGCYCPEDEEMGEVVVIANPGAFDRTSDVDRRPARRRRARLLAPPWKRFSYRVEV